MSQDEISPVSAAGDAIEGEFPPATGQTPRGLASTFRSLRHRNYRLYFFGQMVSLVGSWMQTPAVTWLAFDMTRQSKWPALVTAAQVLPTFLLGVWGGALADRSPKRVLILATQGAFFVLALLLGILAYLNVITPWQLLIIMTVNGLFQAVDLPARLAFVMDMVGREDLSNAVALNSMLFNGARFLGPAIGGLLLIWGPASCFFVNALSYVAVLWALALMDFTRREQGTENRGQGTGVTKQGSSVLPRSLSPVPYSLFGGFAYLASKPTLALLILLTGFVCCCGWPFMALLPGLSEHQLGAGQAGYSTMLSATGLGALAAALILATFGTLERRRVFIGGGVVIMSVGLLGLSFAGTLTLAVICCVLVGLGLILFLATGQSVVQLSAQEHNRGQIMGIWAMVLSGALPLGNFLAGPAADLWGERFVVGLEGAGCAVAACVLLIQWKLRSSVE